ncbi:peptidoglycan DD-metalloendopeptidase family protein [uncultured Pseudacidovorax sp.]|uniref:peptidoglycan DD-metalloendopeptidase family protein n=1 Tax=uncultured Pseudacidovorax sp. TaxID=679313 RepID=UPI0025F2FDE5|nr:peptidoglycan DD-metalloendopeptidase family protein [uncultured Pseudacidovorax sp.]
MRFTFRRQSCLAAVLAAALLAACSGTGPASGAPGSEAAQAGVALLRPTAGPVIAGYDGNRNRGLDFGGNRGDPVLAAAAGRVLYAGPGPRGTGNLVILQHAETLLTTYAHNERLLVRVGDSVARGQRIADLGSSEADRVKLHFEVRVASKTVDPTPYLRGTATAPAAAGAAPATRPTSTRTGSGFFVSATQVVTNAHVVNGCAGVEIAGRGPARLGPMDATADLALIDIAPQAEWLPLSTEPLRLGESLVVVGFPLPGLLAQGHQVTTGSVTALAGVRGDSRVFQMSAPVQSGNSGGPVLDAGGRVVGVVVSRLNAMRAAAVLGDIPQNVNFALSAQTLRSFLDAQKVTWRPAGNRLPPMSVPDVAEVAVRSTVMVRCLPTPG